MESANFRKFMTSSGKAVLAGKNAEQNEAVIEQARADEIVLHTAEAGSPFCNIKGKASKEDIHEAAVFCARYSRDWKKNKKDVIVHYFKAYDTYKKKDMKTGTFGVKKLEVIKIKKEELLQEEK